MARKPIEYVNIEIDGKPVKVPANQVVLWSARDLGFDIPHFCAHKWLEPLGACRLCMVKVETERGMMPKLQTSCSLMPMEGMKIYTEHEEVLRARKEQLEFHLLNHPLECPVCDKGGECMLQDQVMDHGWQEGRFIEEKRVRQDARFNYYIRHNYKRCIHCKRCTSYCSDIDGSYLLRMNERGADSKIESFPDPEEAPRFSGNVIDICPVGALTAQNYRFKMGRPWEQEYVASVGNLDAVGANVWLAGRLGSMARVIPRDNVDIEDGLIDDATRFCWECVDDPRRVTRAVLRGDGGEETVSRHTGEVQAAQLIEAALRDHGGEAVGLVAGAGLNNEDYLALRRFCANSLKTDNYSFGDDLFGPAGADAAALGVVANHFAQLADVLAADTVVVLGADLFDEAPSLGLRLDVAARRGRISLHNARGYASEADRNAHGFYNYGHGNLLRFLRGLVNGLKGSGEVPEEAQALVAALKEVGADCAILFGQEVWDGEDPRAMLAELAALRDAVASANPGASGTYLNPVFPWVNSAGAVLLNNLASFSAGGDQSRGAGSIAKVLEAAASGKVRVLVVIDYDLLDTYPDRILVEKALANVDLVYAGPFTNATAAQAKVHLPLATWAHTEGTVFSLEWRMQKRGRAKITSIGPSALDIANSVSAALDSKMIAGDHAELTADLARLIPDLPGSGLDQFPAEGVLVKLKNVGGTAGHVADLPPAIEGSAESPVLVPKRFLYNDRWEIRNAKVFDQVPRPFAAYLNGGDATGLGIAKGDVIRLKAADDELELAAEPVNWVAPGSIVVNDYNAAQPVNRLVDRGVVKVVVTKMTGVREG